LSIAQERRQVVCMYFREELAGYFQYSLQENTLFMEEIQIQKKFQGIGLFSALFCWLIGRLPSSLCFVRANADKRNTKSQGILQSMGLSICGENSNGVSFCFQGAYADLVRKYS